jgi:hypothetical protein
MLAEFGRGDDGSQDEWEANAKFVEIAWNALTSLCPDDPFVAAEAIGEAFEILRRVTEPADNAALCHNIALARALLAKLSKGKP